LFHPSLLVYVDESGIVNSLFILENQKTLSSQFILKDKRCAARRTGWGPQGHRLQIRFPHRNRGERLTLTAGISWDGMLGYSVKRGSMVRDDFLLFLRFNLLPSMNPFPMEKSVLVLGFFFFLFNPHLFCFHLLTLIFCPNRQCINSSWR